MTTTAPPAGEKPNAAAAWFRANAALIVLVAALVATSLEAVSLWGVDNLLVPLGTVGTLALLHGRLWP